MKDKYSRTIEIDDETIVQVTEYLKGKLLITIAYPEGDAVPSKSMLLTEDEIFALNSMLNDWTKKREC